MRLLAASLVLAAVTLAPASARADDTTPPSLEPDTAADAEGAPAPDRADGIEEGRPQPSWVLWIPRVVLFPARAAVEVVDAPVRLGTWATDRYDVVNRITEMFFSGPPGIWIYVPVLKHESGFGLSYGVKLGHKSVFGTGVQATVRALFGGAYRQSYRLQAETRSIVPETYLELASQLDIRGREPFYGYGNHDLGDASAIPADPDRTALESKFRQTYVTTSLSAALERYDPLVLTARVGHRVRQFHEDGDFTADLAIDRVYDISQVAGWNDGVNQGYAEVEAKYDTTGAGSIWDNPGVTAAGTVLLAFAGDAVGLGVHDYQYLRYGANAVHHIRITDGPRVLSFMGYMEGVRRIHGEPPFLDLPALGGSRRLRGWHSGRFRDNIAVEATAQYQFAITRTWSISLYTDVGNVFTHWRDAELANTRFGYGAEWLWFSGQGLLMRFGVGFSEEDTFLFNLSFSPSFKEQERL